MRIGILGLQGCMQPHEQKFTALGTTTCRVIFPADLDGVDGLIMPGGESTTMLKTATPGLWQAITDFAAAKPVWGVCAGCILMATTALNPQQHSLGLVEMEVVRNAYGAQNESFVTTIAVALPGCDAFEGIFIRAPCITKLGGSVRTLGSHQDVPVLVETDRHLVSTFHPELTDSMVIHQYFLDKVRQCKGTEGFGPGDASFF